MPGVSEVNTTTNMITRILLLALATSVVGLNAQEAPAGGEKPKREGRGERREGFPGLTAEEQAKVKAALEAVKDDATVLAAREAAKTAGEAAKAAREAGKTKEESADIMKAAMEARKAAMEATFAAAIAKDPSIKDLLDKVKANYGKRKEGGQGGESPRKGGRKGEAPAEAPAAK